MSPNYKLFQHHATRLFIAEGESYTSDSLYGLPLQPSEWHPVPQRGREHWADKPCVIVLGEPGSGKSREFESWRDELRDAGLPAFLIALRDFNPSRSMKKFAGPEGEALCAALAGTSAMPITLFLDALDEGRLRFPDVLQHLVDKLGDAPRNRPLHLRLSCRSRDWRVALDRHDLRRLYPDDEEQAGIAIIEILPLDFAAIRVLAREKLGEETKVNEFVDAAKNRNVLPLAGHPLTLGMMLEVFTADGKLGGNRTELFDRACALLTQESNRVHGEKGKPKTTEEDRLNYAKHLAALCVLSNHPQIHIPDKDEPSSGSLPGTLVTDKARLHETLDTGLFTQNLPGSFRFLHPLLADYLAARWVAERLKAGLRPRALLPLLGGSEVGIPTPLRNFTAWLAAFNADIFRHLLSTDPATLIRGDVDIMPPEGKKALVQALADRYAEREFQREVDGFGDLACGLDAQILIDLLDSSRSLAVRHLALEMCLTGKRQDIAAEAWKIAAISKEHQTLRTRAAKLVCELAASEYASRLATLLDCPPEGDPDDELAGIVLDRLYPEHINTSQALRALRVPRNERLVGMFRYFWEEKFNARVPEADEAYVMDVMVEQFTLTEGFLISDPRPKIFLELLTRCLQKKTPDDISQTSKWIAPLCMAGVLGTHAEPGENIKRAHAAMAENTQLKRALIEYDIMSLNSVNSYEWWRTPFPDECLQANDFAWLAEICDREDLRDDVRQNIFGKLNKLFKMGGYIPIEHVEFLETLAQSYSCLVNDWASWTTCNLDDELSKHRINTARRQRKRKLATESHIAGLVGKIPQIKKGVEPGIFDATDEQWRFSHFGAPPDLDKLADAVSPDFAVAAAQGFRAVWSAPPQEAIDWNHQDGSISYWLIAAGYGLELMEAESPLDWASAEEAQLEAASIIALRYTLNTVPDWFVRLYEAHPERLNPRLSEDLSRESNLPVENHPWITAKLTRAAEASPKLTAQLLDWFQTNPLPENQHSLEYLLRLALKQPCPELSEFIAQQTKSALGNAGDNSPTDLRRLSLLLAAWWLMDWKAAQASLETAWFNKPTQQLERIRTFVNEVRNVAETHGWGWPNQIPSAANAMMAPWIYLEPRKEENHTRFLSSRDLMKDLQTAILNAIVAGPAEQAREALQGFLRLPQFEPEYQLIQHYLDDIARRMADESWQPPAPDEVEQVLCCSKRIIRNEEEFYWLADDLCDTDLREVLRCDASLVPLLWEGTKSAGRTPADEKPLQAVLINQLRLLLKETPILYTREQEAFDAKKEDCRLQVTLNNGNKALIPIEIKQAMHAELWTAPKTQLADKYMREHKTHFGLYLVGWYGADQSVAGKKHGYSNPEELEKDLQAQVDKDLADTCKRVKVLVFDCSV